MGSWNLRGASNSRFRLDGQRIELQISKDPTPSHLPQLASQQHFGGQAHTRAHSTVLAAQPRAVAAWRGDSPTHGAPHLHPAGLHPPQLFLFHPGMRATMPSCRPVVSPTRTRSSCPSPMVSTTAEQRSASWGNESAEVRKHDSRISCGVAEGWGRWRAAAHRWDPLC